MPALYPNTVAPEDFSIGDEVKKFVTGNQFSPYTGIVTHVVPSTYKVWVKWAVGDTTQEDPEYLLKVPPFQPRSPVSTNPSGYSSYEKELSEKFFGTVRPRVLNAARKLASSFLEAEKIKEIKAYEKRKMVNKLASNFAQEFVEELNRKISESRKSGLTDIQAYDKLYPKYASSCTDEFLRTAIKTCYNGETK